MEAKSRIVLSICIITLRRPKLLCACLNSLSVCVENLDPKVFEVIVSDDCDKQSALEVTRSFEFAKWVQGPARGVAANRNNVVGSAKGDWIIFIDDDEVAEKNWLKHYMNAILSNSWDVIEGRVQPVDYPDSILWYAPTITIGGAYCTANMAIKRKVLLRLGGFNESFSVSHEDVDLGRRIRKAALKSLYLDQAVVFHPARRYTLAQVWKRMLDLQYQSFLNQTSHNYDLSDYSPFGLLEFCVKYWFRIARFELSARYAHHWKRQLQALFLLLCSTPVASIKLFRIYFARKF